MRISFFSERGFTLVTFATILNYSIRVYLENKMLKIFNLLWEQINRKATLFLEFIFKGLQLAYRERHTHSDTH